MIYPIKKIHLFFMWFLSFFTSVIFASDSSPTSPPNAFRIHHIKKLNQEIPFLGFGALEIGRDWGVGMGKDRQHPTEVTAQKTIASVVNSGIKMIDTASSYHRSEELLGKYLAPQDRRNIFLMTKAGESSIKANDKRCLEPTPSPNGFCNSPASEYDFSAQAIRKNVEESLSRLNTSVLDAVFIHFGPNTKEVIDKGTALAELKKLKAEGKIRHIGASLDDPQQAKRCITSGDYDLIMLEYNLLNQQHKENIALAHQKGMAVIVRGGLGTGLLTEQVKPYINDADLPFRTKIKKLLDLTNNDYTKLTALALMFIYQNPNVDSVIVGMKNPEQVKTNINLINGFKDFHLLSQAIQLIEDETEQENTDSVDAYFAKKMNPKLESPPFHSAG